MSVLRPIGMKRRLLWLVPSLDLASDDLVRLRLSLRVATDEYNLLLT